MEAQVLAVRVDSDTMRQLDEIAQQRGVRRSDVARAALADALRTVTTENENATP